MNAGWIAGNGDQRFGTDGGLTAQKRPKSRRPGVERQHRIPPERLDLVDLRRASSALAPWSDLHVLRTDPN